ncbi:MAG: TRAP transporter large permease [Hydrogenophaga sp.]|uniref:TRAP transporter large permease n=1 Tax=Hydrogenophaga sp. TaxID=1904254 RepID=UPI0026075240|nr:TRAP transporter large permease [Hydrogenophaga sp.]MCV0439575.1 TRAP transporter large permease [Hydrogenophaga sp.]
MLSLIAITLFIVLLLTGAPVAIALGMGSAAALWFFDMPIAVVAQRIVNALDSTTLLAVPMFIFAAALFNATGLTAQLFDFIRMVIGRIRGGLGYVTVLTHLVFSGVSGAALADIGALGKIQIGMMREQGYPDRFSAGICMAAATLGPIFPPSIPLVIFAMAAEVSPVKVLIAGIIPALIIMGFLMVMVWWVARRAALPRDTIEVSRSVFLRRLWFATPALLAPVVLIGGILLGIFGETEAAAVTVVYALAAGIFFYRALSWRGFVDALRETVRSTASIMFIVGAAALFAWVLTIDQVPSRVAGLLLGLSDNPWVLLIIVNVLLLLVGMVLETIAAILILVPILVPALVAAGVDPVHLGVVVVLNLMIGLLTPPVGMSLYMVSTVSGMPVAGVMRAAIPWIVCLLLSLAAVTFLPAASTWLPNLMLG